MLKRLKEQLRDILEDIFLLGAEAPAYMIVNRENDKMLDYMPLKYDDEKVLYFDETKIKMTLFELLCNNIGATLTIKGQTPLKECVIIIALRYIAHMTQSEFAEKMNVPYNTLIKWESQARVPKLQTVLQLAAKVPVSQNLILTVINKN